MTQIQLDVKGMTCGHCKIAVTNALEELDGVKSVEVSVENGKANVEYDDAKVGTDEMKEAIEEQGYDVVA
ncbi:MAG TPA: copper chaperone CopZ [Bacillales bacterium]|nr:copper chaperone CopZ [Bacillales bacterium]HEU5139374.1 copper chaperone CopZ [Bacillales bacterium]